MVVFYLLWRLEGINIMSTDCSPARHFAACQDDLFSSFTFTAVFLRRISYCLDRSIRFPIQLC